MNTQAISRLTRRSLLGLTALALSLWIGVSPAGAATIRVAGSSCTLADAITAANTDAAVGSCVAGDGADEITVFNLSSIDDDLPPVTSDITIIGNGRTIDVNAQTAFTIDGGGQLTFENVDMTVHNRGVLVQSGHLIVTDSIMTGFQKIFLDGPSADVTIRDSSFEGFRAVDGSGRDVLIENSNITGARASVSVESDGQVVIRNSYLEFGGVGVSGDLLFENSILWNAESGISGTSGTLRFATIAGGGIGGVGGGVTVESSIVLAGFPCGQNIQDGGSTFALDPAPNGGNPCPSGFTLVDFTVVAAQPADLGCARSTPTGCVLSVPLPANSPALGASSNCPATDIRGSVRPANSCDAGATQSGPFTTVQAQPPAPTPQPPASPVEMCGGQVVTVSLALGQGPTSGDDVILGTSGPDVINGLGGNDIICGLAGADVINAGPGADRVFGGPGRDRIAGGSGGDVLLGGGGADEIRGQRGRDVIDGGSGSDLLVGGKGSDQLAGGRGRDVLIGGSADDLLVGNRGRDQLLGNGGDDILRGGRGLDDMNGGAGIDGCEATDPGGRVEVRVNCEGNA